MHLSVLNGNIREEKENNFTLIFEALISPEELSSPRRRGPTPALPETREGVCIIASFLRNQANAQFPALFEGGVRG
jgi:hypothetical protein